MSHIFYKLPIQFGPLIDGRELQTCDMGLSIAQHLEIMLHTHIGEQRSDRQYGCAIWELDFDINISNHDWQDTLIRSLTDMILRYEQRLDKPKVTAHVVEVERTFPMTKLTELRKRAQVFVEATIRETGQPFRFQTYLYLGPIAGH